MIWAWIDTSRAETGSSQMMSFGRERQRPGDADALALPAGELGREAVVVLRVEADELHQLLDPPLALRARGGVVDGERVADDRADPAARVQRAVRVLEDHLDLAAVRAHRRRGKLGDVVPVEHDPARGDVVQPAMHRARVDLPQPVSPTRPSVSPRRTSRLTPSTACTNAAAALDERAAADREVLDQVLDRSSTSPSGRARRRRCASSARPSPSYASALIGSDCR